MSGLTFVQSTSPITYFPNPSCFSPSSSSTLPSVPHFASPLSASPSLLGMPSRPASIQHVSSPDPDEGGEGDKTPTRKTVGLHSAGSSPRTRRSSTIGPRSLSGPSRTISNPSEGYGTRRGIPLPLAGLGLGNPELRRTTDHALSSPRRISTTPRTASPPFLGPHNHAKHEAYYAQSEATTASTARFKGDTRHTQSLAAHFTDPALVGASTSMIGGHHRQPSTMSLVKSPRHPPEGSANSVMRKLRSSASIVGMHLGGSVEYDPDVGRAALEVETEEEDVGMRTNGLRVWPKWVSRPSNNCPANAVAARMLPLIGYTML